MSFTNSQNAQTIRVFKDTNGWYSSYKDHTDLNNTQWNEKKWGIDRDIDIQNDTNNTIGAFGININGTTYDYLNLTEMGVIHLSNDNMDENIVNPTGTSPDTTISPTSVRNNSIMVFGENMQLISNGGGDQPYWYKYGSVGGNKYIALEFHAYFVSTNSNKVNYRVYIYENGVVDVIVKSMNSTLPNSSTQKVYIGYKGIQNDGVNGYSGTILYPTIGNDFAISGSGNDQYYASNDLDNLCARFNLAQSSPTSFESVAFIDMADLTTTPNCTTSTLNWSDNNKPIYTYVSRTLKPSNTTLSGTSGTQQTLANGDYYIQYVVTINGETGSPQPQYTINSKSITLTGNVPPTASITLSPINSVCQNSPVTITVNDYDNTLNYKLKVNNVDTGLTISNGTFTYTPNETTSPLNFIVEVTKNYQSGDPCIVDSNAVSLVVNVPPPAPTITLSNSTVCQNSSVDITITNYDSTLIYSLIIGNNSPITSGFLNGIFTYTPTTTTTPLSIVVRVTKTYTVGSCSTDSSPSSLTVNPQPNTPTIALSSTTTCQNTPIDITVTNPQTGINYTLYVSENPTAQSPTYTLNNASFTNNKFNYNPVNTTTPLGFKVRATYSTTGCYIESLPSSNLTVIPQPTFNNGVVLNVGLGEDKNTATTDVIDLCNDISSHDVTFTVSDSLGPNEVFKWYYDTTLFNDQPFSTDSTNNTISAPQTNPINSATSSLQFIDGIYNGVQLSDGMAIKVYKYNTSTTCMTQVPLEKEINILGVPSITTTPSNITKCNESQLASSPISLSVTNVTKISWSVSWVNSLSTTESASNCGLYTTVSDASAVTPADITGTSGNFSFPAYYGKNSNNFPVKGTVTLTPYNYDCVGTPVTFDIIILPTPTVVQPFASNTPVNTLTSCNSSSVSVSFTGSVADTVFDWTNTNTTIGLGSSGTGNISFNGTNTTGAPIFGSIEVTPKYTYNGLTCFGLSKTFTLTINPTPSVSSINNIYICEEETIGPINFSGNTIDRTDTSVSEVTIGATTVYEWYSDISNVFPSTGFIVGTSSNPISAGSTNYRIESFLARNTTTTAREIQTATITVTPKFTYNSVTCTGLPITFSITTIPNPTVDTVSNKLYCPETTQTINFTGSTSGSTTGTTTYEYVRSGIDNWDVTVPSGATDTSGTVIKSGSTYPLTFTTKNDTILRTKSTITITPKFTYTIPDSSPSATVICTGTTMIFDITVRPKVKFDFEQESLISGSISETNPSYTPSVYDNNTEKQILYKRLVGQSVYVKFDYTGEITDPSSSNTWQVSTDNGSTWSNISTTTPQTKIKYFNNNDIDFTTSGDGIGQFIETAFECLQETNNNNKFRYVVATPCSTYYSPQITFNVYTQDSQFEPDECGYDVIRTQEEFDLLTNSPTLLTNNVKLDGNFELDLRLVKTYGSGINIYPYDRFLYVQFADGQNVFDGNNKSITYINSDSTSKQYSGFIRLLGGTVKNLSVKQGSGQFTLATRGGWVVRSDNINPSYGTVDNCSSNLNISGQSGGGLVGAYFGKYTRRNTNINNTGYWQNEVIIVCGINIDDTSDVREKILCEGRSIIKNCYSTGNLIGLTNGGIAGLGAGADGDCIIDCCYSTGNIGDLCSGIISNLSNLNYSDDILTKIVIRNCYSAGNSSGGNISGGILLNIYNGNVLVSNCYNLGFMNNNTGGIIGSIGLSNKYTVKIENCYAIGTSNNPLDANIIYNLNNGSSGSTLEINNSYSRSKIIKALPSSLTTSVKINGTQISGDGQLNTTNLTPITNMVPSSWNKEVWSPSTDSYFPWPKLQCMQDKWGTYDLTFLTALQNMNNKASQNVLLSAKISDHSDFNNLEALWFIDTTQNANNNLQNLGTPLPLNNANFSTNYSLTNSTAYVNLTVRNKTTGHFIKSLATITPHNIQMDFSTTNVSCAGLSDGKATITIYGLSAVRPYNVIVKNTITNVIVYDAKIFDTANPGIVNLDKLSANSYDVTVYDGNGVEDNETISAFTINTTADLTLAGINSTITHVTCHGGNDGQITITGLQAGYKIYFDNNSTVDNVTGQSFTKTGLYAGLHAVVITTSDNKCAETRVYEVKEPQPLTFTNIAVQSVDVYGSATGSISLTANSGALQISPANSYFRYSLIGPSSNLNSLNHPVTFNGLLAGLYLAKVEVEVSSSLPKCTYQIPITVPQRGPLTLSVAQQKNVSCFDGADGEVLVYATGGNNNNYTFTINPSVGSNTPDNSTKSCRFTSLTAQEYTIGVNDGSITYSIKVNITQPPAMTISYTQLSHTCDNKVTIQINTSGGAGGYTYSNNGTTWKDSNILELDISNDTLQTTLYAKDINGCEKNTGVIIFNKIQPLAINPITSNNVTCFGGNTGSITINYNNINGGYKLNDSIPTKTYTVYINGQKQGTLSTSNQTLNLNNLYAGTYGVNIVSDLYNCQATQIVNITQPEELKLYVSSITNIKPQGGSNGSITVTASGGSGLFQYSNNGGTYQTSGTFSDLVSGHYAITVRDTNNQSCTATTSVFLSEEDKLVLYKIYSNNCTCSSGNDGSIKVLAVGGNEDYTFTLLNSSNVQVGNSNTNGEFTGLDAGTYTARVTDTANGTKEISITISRPTQLTITGNKTDVTKFGYKDGQITGTISGGTGPYTVTLTENINSILPSTLIISGGLYTFDKLDVGNYIVTVRDRNNCNAQTTLGTLNIGTAPQFSLAPSTFIDNGKLFNINFNNADYSGSLPFEYCENDGPWLDIDPNPVENTTPHLVVKYLPNNSNTNQNNVIKVKDTKGNIAQATLSVPVYADIGVVIKVNNKTLLNSSESINTKNINLVKNTLNCFAVTSITNGSGQYSYTWTIGSETYDSDNDLQIYANDNMNIALTIKDLRTTKQRIITIGINAKPFSIN